MSSKSTSLLPVISCLIAATLWGLFWYPLRVLENMGVSGLWASVMIYTATLVPLIPQLWIHRKGISGRIVLLGLIGLSAGWANLGFMLAMLEGNVVRGLLLFYLSPVWTVLLGMLILDERLTGRAWISIVLAMFGAIIMLVQPGATFLFPGDSADLLAVSAGFAFAVMNVLIRKSGDVPIILKMGFTCLGVLFLSFTGLLAISIPAPVLDQSIIILVISVGSVGMLIMIFTAQYGVTHLPVHRSAVIFLFEIVAGAVSAALLTNELISIREWTGGGLVIVAAWLTAIDSIRSRKNLSQSK